MKQLGHGDWISIERHANDQADTPLTLERIKETMSRAGRETVPDDKTIRAHIAGEAAPQGKSRLAYEIFWYSAASATPISPLVRLTDIDDSERHSELHHDFNELTSTDKVKQTKDERVKEKKRSKLVIRWHEYVRSLELKMALLEAAIKGGVSSIEHLYVYYRCHYRLADILYEGHRAGLPIPHGQSEETLRNLVRQHYEFAWEFAAQGLKAASGELVHLNKKKRAFASSGGEEPSTTSEQVDNVNIAIYGMRIMRDLFVVGCATAAENRVALALTEMLQAKDDALKEIHAEAVVKWRNNLRSTSMSDEAITGKIVAAVNALNTAFERRCAVEFAQDRVAFVAAMFVVVAGEASEKDVAEKELGTSLRALREAIHDSGDGQSLTKEKVAWLIGLPTIQNLINNGIISKKEIEHVLAHS
jgi:hypothetical protein